MNLTDSINYIIRKRRSIYPAQYSDQKIDDSVIEQILENANWAPTHALTQPWRFTVFCGEGLRKLATFQSNLYRELSKKDGTFNQVKFDKLSQKPLLASHIISIGMSRDEKSRVPELEEISAVACAVQNMYLTANALGLGCYWGSGGITYKKEANEFFGLNEQDILMGFFYLGVPKPNVLEKWPDGKRSTIKDKVTWVSE